MKTPVMLGLSMVGLALLGACSKHPLLVHRSSCPAVAVPEYLGTMTQFSPADSRKADAMVLTAQVSRLEGSCFEDETRITTDVRFDVTAQRRHAGQAEDVTLPLFVAVVRAGDHLVSKERTAVTLHFPAGKLTASASGTARADIDRGAATLAPAIAERITKKRTADDPDALIDPLANAEVRTAVRNASFEVLVGFQLDRASAGYNMAY